MSSYITLCVAFRVLTDRQLERFAWHLLEKTPVCCGRKADLFASLEGGG